MKQFVYTEANENGEGVYDPKKDNHVDNDSDSEPETQEHTQSELKSKDES